MRTPAQKKKYTKTFLASRAAILADGGKQLNIVLDKAPADVLEALRAKHPEGTYKAVVTDLLLASKPRRGGGRSK